MNTLTEQHLTHSNQSEAEIIDIQDSPSYFKDINKKLENATAAEVVKWVLSIEGKIIVTTNFGPQEAVLLHIVNQITPIT